jgi:hypothetical protein
VRVKRPHYYHHGIYVGNGEVIHYDEGTIGAFSDPKLIKVIKTSVKDYLRGGYLEVRVYSRKEIKNKKSVDEILIYAKKHIGIDGYDYIKHNCEHFSNECAFGVSYSAQSESFKAQVREMTKNA